MKFLSNDGLKVVLTKIKELFYTKKEVDEKLKSVSGGGTSIEGYFQIINKSYGMYCIVLETDDKYEIWSNLKILKQYKNNNFNNIPKGKKYCGNVIAFKPSYEWTQIVSNSKYEETPAIQFNFSNDGIEAIRIADNFNDTIKHSGDTKEFVFLGSVIKK